MKISAAFLALCALQPSLSGAFTPAFNSGSQTALFSTTQQAPASKSAPASVPSTSESEMAQYEAALKKAAEAEKRIEAATRAAAGTMRSMDTSISGKGGDWWKTPYTQWDRNTVGIGNEQIGSGPTSFLASEKRLKKQESSPAPARTSTYMQSSGYNHGSGGKSKANRWWDSPYSGTSVGSQTSKY